MSKHTELPEAHWLGKKNREGRCSQKVDWGETVKGLHRPTVYLDFVLWKTGSVHRFLSGGVTEKVLET